MTEKQTFHPSLSRNNVYLIGIGGVGMSSLARVLKYRGYRVRGSDLRATRTTEDLNREGISVFVGQNQFHFNSDDVIVHSTAIDPQHPELVAARQAGLQIFHRAQVLSCLLNQSETAIAVTGTHGKTTTASMISFVLSRTERDPTCLVGGDVINFNSNVVLGGEKYFVAEVDESDKSHMLYAPHYGVITNLEEDHVEHYSGFEDLEKSFLKFLGNFRNPGIAITCCEDLRLQDIVKRSGRPNMTYGFSPKADFRAENVVLTPFGSQFDFVEMGLYASPMQLSVPGIHNVLNACGALTALLQIGVDLDWVRESMPLFKGARRRLEVKWNSQELVVIDDYAHHPTEVMASVRAIQEMGRKVTVIFQPHRFSRTRRFYREFAEAFNHLHVDELILTEVYSAGESNPDPSASDLIYSELQKTNRGALKFLKKGDILNYLFSKSWENDIVAFLGAGDIGEIANDFSGRFKSFAAA